MSEATNRVLRKSSAFEAAGPMIPVAEDLPRMASISPKTDGDDDSFSSDESSASETPPWMESMRSFTKPLPEIPAISVNTAPPHSGTSLASTANFFAKLATIDKGVKRIKMASTPATNMTLNDSTKQKPKVNPKYGSCLPPPDDSSLSDSSDDE